ncbi:MAG: hypothetical protein MK207_12490 [Saprospiraceae bacterium]|nr:hypothetical protein [Saprospiraceae bacterium]
MKIQIKAKDFADKETLEKNLSTKLKKPLAALLDKKVPSLPFCYEVDYFSVGMGFISIGVTKEVYKLYKTKRSKGQGTEGKIDKKKVAYGNVSINDEGQVEFCVLGGIMKHMQAKKVIKSIPILKKKIGDNFVIIKGEAAEDEEVVTDSETPNVNSELNKAQTPSDVISIKQEASKIVAAFKNFIGTEWAEVQKNSKSAKNILAADKKGRAVAALFNKWLENNKNNEELSKEINILNSHSTKLNTLLEQIKSTVDKIKKAKGSDISIKELDNIFVDLSGKITDLLSSFGSEIESIEGLKESLEAIK